MDDAPAEMLEKHNPGPPSCVTTGALFVFVIAVLGKIR